MPPRRRTADAIRAVDGLVHAHLEKPTVDTRTLANLAVIMAAEYSGAARGILLVDDGKGLEANFSLGADLSTEEANDASFDAEIVAEATKNRRVANNARGIAAPVIVVGVIRGVLYLEAGMAELGDEAVLLAEVVASRIATLIHSAVLVEETARTGSNVEALEALGACLSAGKLNDESLKMAVDSVLSATDSREAILGILDDDGKLLDLHVEGNDPEELKEIATSIAKRYAADVSAEVGSLLGEPQMAQPLRGDLVQNLRHDGSTRPLGFFAVRRPGGHVYRRSDVSFFQAVAHLLAGALTRLAYFRKASEDALTGAGSRLALELAFAQAVETAMVSQKPLAVMLVDLDKFKDVNDNHGHLAGDAVLSGIADLLRSRLRGMDFVARYGGDEFLVLLPETTIQAAYQLAEQLRELAVETKHGEEKLSVTLSIGVAAFPKDGDNPRELLRMADQALYSAKRAGRNRVGRA